MAKKNCMMSNRVGKGKKSNQEAKELIEMGYLFGQSIIEFMALFVHDWKGIGVATAGLAKALAAVKAVARDVDINIDDLFKSELAIFEEEFIHEGSEMVDLNEK